MRPLPRKSDPQRDTAADVVLIGYQDQGNLGMGYLAAVLQQQGYIVDMVDIRDGAESIASRLIGRPPLVVGFSLIFQYFLPQYRHLATVLRSVGLTSHFTMGGHYPSLCHEELLRNFPELDSVVRYEGEQTLPELVDRIRDGGDWRQIAGIAFLSGRDVVVTEPRPLVHDLDTLPFPYRPYEPEQIGGYKTLPLLASRGCARRCSFCSIHTFYRTAPGKVVRARTPEKIVEEMLSLQQRFQARVFLFQDDDFPLWGNAGRRWADELIDRIHDSGLAESTVWKISCRGEYVEPELFSRLRDAGLFLVYMGIESGVDQGLKILHKEMTVEQNLAAIRTLKEVGIQFSYGFMLFDPSSTFDSVRENVGFLRKIVGDGSAAATFCRMLPYGGTPIRDHLAQQGRLRGDLTHPDYEFLDPRLNEYYLLLDRVMAPWIHNDGISNEFNYALDEFHAMRRLVRGLELTEVYETELRTLIRETNERLFRLVEESSVAFERGDRSLIDPEQTKVYVEQARGRLVRARNNFVAENIYRLIEPVAQDCASGPVMAPQVH
ncbi:MAG: B12-binding domain-containing radical SAM protein [Proteobacteria bacterium]|nr:MAG: B12-binding domain-containing radical SAM protein [Pseudomonadota bacterium]